MKKISLYLHIPFCVRKCGYCDFISFEYDSKEIDQYLNNLIKEIEYYGKHYLQKIHTIFIGGGTPSLLTGNQMKMLMTAVDKAFDLSECVEVSMESNPGTLNLENLLDYKDAGINRISMGVQTLNNDTLKSLDRIHDVQMVYDSVSAIKEAGLTNFNMDLMFGLPGQTLEQLESTVDKMIELDPTHISAYSLKYEEGTEFYKKLESGELEVFEDELDRDMYHLIIKKLGEAGYLQYEISNFSKAGYECQHNLVYWEKKPYLGLGIGAHSYMAKKRFFNATTLNDYDQLIKKENHSVVGSDEIDPEDDLFESIILSLRLNKGLEINKINALYDIDFLKSYKKEIDRLLKDALIELNNEVMTLTSLGRDLSNQVFVAFLN